MINKEPYLIHILSSIYISDVVIHQLLGHETSLADEFAVVSRAGDSEEALEKISKNLGMRDTSNIETVLKDWKAMVHPPSYNQRTSLADAVFPVVGKDVAVSILSSNYKPST